MEEIYIIYYPLFLNMCLWVSFLDFIVPLIFIFVLFYQVLIKIPNNSHIQNIESIWKTNQLINSITPPPPFFYSCTKHFKHVEIILHTDYWVILINYKQGSNMFLENFTRFTNTLLWFRNMTSIYVSKLNRVTREKNFTLFYIYWF